MALNLESFDSLEPRMTPREMTLEPEIFLELTLTKGDAGFWFEFTLTAGLTDFKRGSTFFLPIITERGSEPSRSLTILTGALFNFPINCRMALGNFFTPGAFL